MSAVIVLAPIKLAEGKSEADLLEASEKFQRDFVDHEAGVLRRELVRDPNGGYMDIVQFRSKEDFADVMQREQESAVCMEFFSVMELSDMNDEVSLYQVLSAH